MAKSAVLKLSLPYLAAALGSLYFYKLFIKPFLSPLRKMPGRPYKPLIGNMFEALKEEAMNNGIMWMKECNSRIIRFYFLYGEERVLVADPVIVRHILVTNSKNYIHMSQTIDRIMPGFLLTLNGEEHHALRKLLNPAFNSTSVNDYIPIFEEIASKVVRDWKIEVQNSELNSATVAAQSYMGRLTLDIICRCGFDYDIKAVDDPDNIFVESFRRILQGSQLRLSQMLPLQWLPSHKNKQLADDMRLFQGTITKVLQDKLTSLSFETSPDLLSRLLMARDDMGNPLSDSCIRSQIGGFLFAGFETTSMNLTWTLLMLAQHADVQERTRQEVMDVTGKGSQPITADHVESLRYLTCVINESLRLLPPVTTVFRKTVKDDILGGYPVPAGTPVGISVGALHRLEANWQDPESFKPERFMDNYDRYKFMPFGAGPYMCIGYIFSLMESKVVLANLLKHFRISLPVGYTYRRVRHIVMSPHPPLKLVIEPL